MLNSEKGISQSSTSSIFCDFQYRSHPLRLNPLPKTPKSLLLALLLF